MADESQYPPAVMLYINIYPTQCRKFSVGNILSNSTTFHNNFCQN